MVATIREGGMVVDATRDLIASNGFESGSEQQSVSSEISNPRDTMKDQQLSETASPSSIASEIPTIVVGKPVLQVTTPPLSPERRPTNTNTVETTSTVSQQQQQAIPQPSPSTSPITRGDHDILPRSIDGYYPQQQQPQQLGDQQNSNDSRKLFVGGLPKDGRFKRSRNFLCCEIIFSLLLLTYFLFCHFLLSFGCSDRERILLLLLTIWRNPRFVHCIRSRYWQATRFWFCHVCQPRRVSSIVENLRERDCCR